MFNRPIHEKVYPAVRASTGVSEAPFVMRRLGAHRAVAWIANDAVRPGVMFIVALAIRSLKS